MEIVVKSLLVILTWGLVVSVVAIASSPSSSSSSSSSSSVKSLFDISARMARDVDRRSPKTNPDQQTAKDLWGEESADTEAIPANGSTAAEKEPQSTLPLEITSNGKGEVEVLSSNEQCATDVESSDSSSEPSSSSSEEEGQQKKRTVVDSRSVPKDHLRHHSAKRCRRQAESKTAPGGGDEKQANDKKLADDKSAAAAAAAAADVAANKAENEKLKRQDEEQEQEQQEQQQQQANREQKNEAKLRRDFDSLGAGQAQEAGEEEKQEAAAAAAKTRRGGGADDYDDEKADAYRREETDKNEDAALAEIRERKDDDDDDGELSDEENAKMNRRSYAAAASKARKQRRDFEYDPPLRRRSLKRRRGGDDDDDDGDRAKRYLRARRKEDDDNYRRRRYDAGDDKPYRAEREFGGGQGRGDDRGWNRGRRHSAATGDRGSRVRFWRADAGSGQEAASQFSLGEDERNYLERKARDDDDDDGVYLERKARDDDDDDGAYLERKVRDDDDDDGAYLQRKMRDDDDDDGAYLERKMRDDDDDDGAYLERKMRDDDDDDGAYLQRKMRDDDDDGAYLDRKMRYADDDDDGNNYANLARSARHSGYEAASEAELRSARDDDESKAKRLKTRGVQHGGGASDARGKRDDDDDDGNRAIRGATADEGGAAENNDAKWLRGLRSVDRRAKKKQVKKARLSNIDSSKASGAASSDRKRRGDKESLASASGSFLNADAAAVRGMRYVEDGVKTERAADGKDDRKKRLFGILDDYIPGRKRAVGESESRQSKSQKGRSREKRQATYFDQSNGSLNLKTSGKTDDFRKTLDFDERIRGRKRRSLSMEGGKIVDPEKMFADQTKTKMKSASEALKSL